MQRFLPIGVVTALALLTTRAHSETSRAPAGSTFDADRSSAQQAPTTEKADPILSDRTPRASGMGLRGIGLRASSARTDTDGAESAAWSAGGDLYERGVGVLRLDFWSARYFDELWIGYGSEGFRYQLAGQLGFGVIWLFDEASHGGGHGIVTRFAMRGHLRREGDVFSSEVRVPGGELGYHWTSGNRQLELIAHGGATLTGRFNPLDERRVLRGATYGASLSFEWARLRLDADTSLVAATAELGGVLQARAHLCALSQDRPQGRKASGADPKGRPSPPAWALCLDFRGIQGRTSADAVDTPLLESSRQMVGGLSIAVGELLHL